MRQRKVYLCVSPSLGNYIFPLKFKYLYCILVNTFRTQGFFPSKVSVFWIVSNKALNITSTSCKPQTAAKLDLFVGSLSCWRKHYTTHSWEQAHLLHYSKNDVHFPRFLLAVLTYRLHFLPWMQALSCRHKPGFGHQEGLVVICQGNLLSSRMEIHHQIQAGLRSARGKRPLTWGKVTCLTPLRLTTFQTNVKPPRLLMQRRHDIRTSCCMVMVVNDWSVSPTFRMFFILTFICHYSWNN